LFLKFGFGFNFVCYFSLCCFFVIIAFIDLEHKLIFDSLTYPVLVIGFAASLVQGKRLFDPVMGILAGGGLLYLIAVLGQAYFKREAMGGGDIKLAAAMGAYLGARQIIILLAMASVLGALVGGFMLLTGKKERREEIPFGPFMVLAGYAMIFFNRQITGFLTGNKI